MEEKYRIIVAGTELAVRSEDDEAYVKRLAARLNDEINDLLLTHARSTKLEAILVCALNNLDDRMKLEEENRELKKQLERQGNRFGKN